MKKILITIAFISFFLLTGVIGGIDHGKISAESGIISLIILLASFITSVTGIEIINEKERIKQVEVRYLKSKKNRTNVNYRRIAK